jgi:hypothetical protein
MEFAGTAVLECPKGLNRPDRPTGTGSGGPSDGEHRPPNKEISLTPLAALAGP